MPQMAPLSWLFYSLTFVTILVFVSSLFYYSSSLLQNTVLLKKNTPLHPLWKW